MRFPLICCKEKDSYKEWDICFQILCKRNHSKRWKRRIKDRTVRKLQIKQRRINTGNSTISSWLLNPCNLFFCKTWNLVIDCSNITSIITSKRAIDLRLKEDIYILFYLRIYTRTTTPFLIAIVPYSIF